MRTRRWLTWLIFAVCAAAVVEGLGWVSWQAIRSERRELQARAEADFQDTVRLALWRMESDATPIIAQEAARPYFHYRSFYPAERAYTRMWQEVEKGEVLVPSPLLESSGQCIRLHYQVEPDGSVTSPQAPTGNMLDLAESQYVDGEFIVLASQMLGELTTMLAQSAQPAAPGLADALTDRRKSAQSDLQDSAKAPQEAQAKPIQQQVQEQDPESLKKVDQAAAKEFEARQKAYANASTQSEGRRGGSKPAPAPATVAAPPPPAALPAQSFRREADRSIAPTDKLVSSKDDSRPATGAAGEPAPQAGGLGYKQEQEKSSPKLKQFQAPGPPPIEVEQDPLRPFWRTNPASGADELLFQRSVRVRGRQTVQGFWMDWPALRTRLQTAAGDLLPHMQLLPIRSEPDQSPLHALRLASLPVYLIPGDTPTLAARVVNPTHTTLVVTWLAVLGSIIAIAVVLQTSMELGDRRGRFVSAVTHELRTPLTTFCLYTEMLADGIVKEDTQRAQYLGTLKGESRRLAGIVENVLDYARLGGPRRVNGHSLTPVAQLLAEIGPALCQAARQGGMTLEIDPGPAGAVQVDADPRTVERVLLNLVDNSCKYASDGPDRTLSLRVSAAKGGRRGEVEFLYSDRGPGIPRHDRRRIFEPFHRARRDAQGPKSGLGLGLALARGLARGLGGDLDIVRDSAPGVTFKLTLPAANS